MSDQRAMEQTLISWLQVPRAVETAVAGLTAEDLDLRGGPNGWSIRENVHHVVESNLVACSIVIAAVGNSGCTYDCSWMTLEGKWMERMGYTGAPVAAAIDALSALCRHIGSLLQAAPDRPLSVVNLLLTPGGELCPMTAEQVIQQEVEHARGHLQEIEQTLKQRSGASVARPDFSGGLPQQTGGA